MPIMPTCPTVRAPSQFTCRFGFLLNKYFKWMSACVYMCIYVLHIGILFYFPSFVANCKVVICKAYKNSNSQLCKCAIKSGKWSLGKN